MAKSDSKDDRDKAKADEYTLEGHGHRALMAERTVAAQGGFFLPYLRASMRVLDAGCGAGSITLGIAQAVAPGEVIGVDIEAGPVGEAARAATDRGLGNAHFQVASVYELPFADNSFDAVFSHALIEHLNDPLRALREFWRVLKPGGVAGVRNGDIRGKLLSPTNELLEEAFELLRRLRDRQGASWAMGPETRALLRQAGFRILDAGASYDCHTSENDVRLTGARNADMCRNSYFATQAVALGWADREQLERMAQAWLAWAENPDAFSAFSHVHVVAAKP